MRCVIKQLNIRCAFCFSAPRLQRPAFTDVKSPVHCARYSSYPPYVTQLFSPSHARVYRNYLQHSITDWREQLELDDIDIMTGTKSITSNTSSGKRKRSSPKFYAVKVGRIPGIYHSWEDCKAQTEGFKSQFKSFPTLTEAEAFMRGTSSPSADTSKTPRFYAVAVGHVPGVYTDYPSVQAQTKNCPGARQQSFATRAEAEAYVNEFRRDSSAPISLRGDLSEESSLAASKGSKKQKKKDAVVPALTSGDVTWEPGMGPLPDGAEDGFDPNIKLDTATGNIRDKTVEERSKTKMQPTGDFLGTINVYTDGSSLGNGQLGAVGGVGVYFGPNDSRNISEPLRGGRQTNQRAELTAVARALDHVPIDRSVLIHTDSNYSIKCLTEWFQKWETNNWKSSSGKDVENKDLVEPIIARIRERDLCRAKTEFKWIKGHANDPGNTAADLLAVQGSQNSTLDLRAADIKDISATLSGRPGSKLEETYSEKKEVFNEEDGAEYDRIFADLEAERSAQKDDHGFTSDVVAQLTEASTWEGQGGIESCSRGSIDDLED